MVVQLFMIACEPWIMTNVIGARRNSPTASSGRTDLIAVVPET